MRTALILATIVGISAVAAADDLPSLQQCKSGWKSKYRAVWKKSDFEKAWLRNFEERKTRRRFEIGLMITDVCRGYDRMIFAAAPPIPANSAMSARITRSPPGQ